MLAGIALAGPLAGFYGEPDVRWLFVALSVGFLVSALGTTQMALLVREMEFRKLELRQIAATLVGAAVGITIALVDFGAWAIVGQLLAEACVSTVAALVAHAVAPVAARSRPRASAGSAASPATSSARTCSTRRAATLSSLLIGRVLGAAALGTYALATNVILDAVLAHRSAAAAGVLPGVLADERRPRADGGRLDPRDAARRADLDSVARRARRSSRRTSSQVVLGPRWSDATPVIQILAGRRDHPVAADAERRGAAGARTGRERCSAFTMLWFAGSLARRRRRAAVGHRRRRRLLRGRDAPDRAAARLRHDARARDPALAVRPLALRRRAGDGADGRRCSSSPASALVEAGLPALAEARAARRARRQSSTSPAASGALPRSRGRSGAPSAAGSAAGAARRTARRRLLEL